MMTGLATKTEPLANRAGSAGDVSAFARPVETNVVQNDTCNAFSQSHRNERCAERYLQRRAV